MSFETRKAMRRRLNESAHPWREWFSGSGLDVGCGPDDALIREFGFVGFDEKDGDANRLSSYFQKESFDVIHGSHVLEHMRDPVAALRDWLSLLKPGGHVIQTVPDWCAYERMTWPSRFNPDHKSSWSMIYKGSIAPIHCHIPTFLAKFDDIAEVLLARYVEENYDWNKPLAIDQTWNPEDGVEIWNEFILRKK